MFNKIVFLGMVSLLIIVVLSGSVLASTSEHQLQVKVDPRIELLSVVQLLSGYMRINSLDLEYKDEILDYFQAYQNHQAVKIFKGLANAGFSYDAPPTAMLYLSQPPELEYKVPFTDYLKQRAGGERKLRQFVDSLRDFAVESNFIAFYNQHQAFYEQLVEGVKDKIEDEDYVADLEGYYRSSQEGYYIILAPLFHAGGYGPRVEIQENRYNIYNICGPSNEEEQKPIFGSEWNLCYLVWHEFSHSFINPLTEQYSHEVGQYSSLLAPIAEKMKSQAYPNWSTVVNEHIVRAVTARLTYLKYGKTAGDTVLRNEKNRGFVYIEDLTKALEEYENSQEYSNFEEFYPEILKVFKKLLESDLGEDYYTTVFRGPINSASQDRDSVVLIIPTNENDKKDIEGIKQYVTKVKEMFFKESAVLTDIEALKNDLSTKSILAYGTIEGNLWLKEHSSLFPFLIKRDKIIADKTYHGEDLRHISALPNPYNEKRALVIYTAQQAEDIVGINKVYHGPTDYVVASGEEVLQSADYGVKEEQWEY